MQNADWAGWKVLTCVKVLVCIVEAWMCSTTLSTSGLGPVTKPNLNLKEDNKKTGDIIDKTSLLNLEKLDLHTKLTSFLLCNFCVHAAWSFIGKNILIVIYMWLNR